MTLTPSAIRARAGEVRKASEALRSSGVEERAAWLSHAADALGERAHQRRAELSRSTGLDEAMVDWASRTTLETVRENALIALHAEAGPLGQPLDALPVVLAGNVFTAAVRAAFVPLLFGVPVLVKPSSSEPLFPLLMRDALRETNARLGASFDLAAFEGGDREAEAAFVESATTVSVYGSDATVAAMTARLPDVRIVAHGHGVSVACCGAASLRDDAVDVTVERLALDVCAYDQRGCLSPQVIFVAQTDARSAEDFARRFSERGLAPMGARLPRGGMPVDVGAVQAQWRGLAEVEGTLFSGPDHAVAVRPPEPIRWSPGYRNVTVSPVADLAEALRVVVRLGAHLKCIGVDPSSLPEVQTRLAQTPLEAYACPIGEMQTPALDAPADGRPVWQGLTRR